MRYLSFLIVLATFFPSSAQCANQRPNFVIIMADDLGYSDLGCYGNTEIATPNIDALATTGVRLTDYHSNGAVCSPTRAALLTGRYQQRSGISGVVTAANHRHTGLDTAETTFANTLSNHGYATAIIGKWHLGYAPEFNPIHNGFERFTGYVSGNIDFFSHIDQAGHLDWWQQDKIDDEAGYTTHLITNHAVEFIETHANQPFCLYVAHEAPHYPYQGPSDAAIRSLNKPGKTQGVRQDIAQAYREMIVEMDKGVGEIIETIQALDLTSKTMIVFCSDNGANKNGNNHPWRGFKGQIWEGGHRVPAIASWPGVIPANSTSSVIALSMDWFPTMLAAANMDLPTDNQSIQKPLDGTNLLPFLTGTQQQLSRTVFWSINKAMASRRGPYKLVVETNRNQPTENLTEEKSQLFNLTTDPGETTPIENDGVERELRGALETWHKSWKHVPQRS